MQSLGLIVVIALLKFTGIILVITIHLGRTLETGALNSLPPKMMS